jgi:arylsulfatase A-like enzyme
MKRWLVSTLGASLAAALGFAVTWSSMQRPWVLQVPYRPDPASLEDDRILVQEAAAALSASGGAGPDIVLIVLDTVRADHLELYGYPHSTMPRLTRWAEQGLVHEQFLSTSSWTLPSHASLFTGQYPASHRAHGRTVEKDHIQRFKTGRPTRRILERPLARDAVTVAERLWDAGYATLGIAANRAFLDRSWRLDQGFELWICEDARKGASFLPYTRADRITAMSLEALDAVLPALAYPEQEGRAPVFLFVNYMEAHGPYVPREGYVRDPSKLIWRYRTGDARDKLAWSVLAAKKELPAAVREGWVEAYDAELRFLDEQLAALLEGLEQRGIGPDAHIMILSDHGEYFGEQQLLAHSKDLYEPGLRVPFIHRGPGIGHGRSDLPLQILDLAPRVVALAGAEPLPLTESSEDLMVAELYGSRGRDLRNPRFGHRFNRVRRSFQRGDRKIIMGSDGSFEAYDLASDPRELQDLGRVDWAEALALEAEAWMRARDIDDSRVVEDDDEAEVDEADLEALRALGYVD